MTSFRRSTLASKSKIPPQGLKTQSQVLLKGFQGIQLFRFHGMKFSPIKPWIIPREARPCPSGFAQGTNARHLHQRQDFTPEPPALGMAQDHLSTEASFQRYQSQGFEGSLTQLSLPVLPVRP